MTAIIPFDFSTAVVAAPMRRRASSINADAMMGSAGFPILTIKGKVFTLVKDAERKPLMMNVEGELVPRASVTMAVVRANAKARKYYTAGYVEGDSDGKAPTCFSYDSIAPDATAAVPQAKKCGICPHAQWGSKVSTDGNAAKGTACTVNTRLAIVDPTLPETALLLAVPAGSRASFSDAVKLADGHGKDYNEVAMKISFDNAVATPKLIFRPMGLLSPEAQEKVRAMYDDPAVLDIIGTPTPVAAAVDDSTADFKAAIAAEVIAPAKVPLPAPAKASIPAVKAAAPVVVEPEQVEQDVGYVLGGLKAADEPAPVKQVGKLRTPTKAASAVAPVVQPVEPEPQVAEPAVTVKSSMSEAAAADLLNGLGALLHATDD